MFKKLLHVLSILIIFLFVSQSAIASEVRDIADLVMTSEQKAIMEDNIEAVNKTNSQMRKGLGTILGGLEKANDDFANQSPKMQKLINLGNATLKKQANNALGMLQESNKIMEKAGSVKKKLNGILQFYDKFKPEPDNPYRSLEVIINLLDEAEALLPDKVWLEEFRNSPVFMIRTGIGYFKEAVKLALEGSKRLQQQFRDRAAGCIGNVDGDDRGDSKKRKQFTKIDKTGDTICYTGVRPGGGEIWKNTDGDNVYNWDTKKEKWTHLRCSFGDAKNVFDLWRYAYKKVITSDRINYWCTGKQVDVFKNEYIKAEKNFLVLNSPTNCQRDILDAIRNKTKLKVLMDYLGRDKKTFIAKYVFQVDDVRNSADFLFKAMTNNILFDGYIKDTKGRPVSSATVFIKAGTKDGVSNAKVDHYYRILAKVDASKHQNLRIKLSVIATNYASYQLNWPLQKQCNKIPITLAALHDTKPSGNIRPIKNKNDCAQIRYAIKTISNKLSTNKIVLSSVVLKSSFLFAKLNKSYDEIKKLEKNHKNIELLAANIAQNSTKLENLSKKICEKINSLNDYNIPNASHQKNFTWIINNQSELRVLLDDSNKMYKKIQEYKTINRTKKVTKSEIDRIQKEIDTLEHGLSKKFNYLDYASCPQSIANDAKNLQIALSKFEGEMNNALSQYNKVNSLYAKNKKINYNQEDSQYVTELAASYKERGANIANDGAFCAVLAEDIMKKVFIPNVEGMDVFSALLKLKNRNFNVKEDKLGKTPSEKEYLHVKRQSPDDRQRVEKGTSVTISYYDKLSEDVNKNVNKCLKWPGSVQKINPNTKKLSCYCVGNSVWNLNKTKCVSRQEYAMENANCSKYNNSIKIWSSVNGRVECSCPSNLQWNTNGTACVEKNPIEAAMASASCDGFLGSTKIWNSSKRQVECACQNGLVWNRGRTGCIRKQTSTQNANVALGNMINVLSGIVNASRSNNTYHPISNTSRTNPYKPNITKGYAGRQCPRRNPSKYGSIKVDSNNNPNDNIYIKCNYFKDGALESQNPYINNTLDGLGLRFQSRQPHRLSSKITYRKGRHHGTAIWWDNDRKTGRYYMREKQTNIVNGISNGTTSSWYSNGNLHTVSRHRNGRVYESKVYDRQNSGRLINCTKYSSNGNKTSCVPKRRR